MRTQASHDGRTYRVPDEPCIHTSLDSSRGVSSRADLRDVTAIPSSPCTRQVAQLSFDTSWSNASPASCTPSLRVRQGWRLSVTCSSLRPRWIAKENSISNSLPSGARMRAPTFRPVFRSRSSVIKHRVSQRSGHGAAHPEKASPRLRRRPVSRPLVRGFPESTETDGLEKSVQAEKG